MVDYFENHYLLEHEIGASYVKELRRTLRCFSDWLGHPAGFADFNDSTVNGWLLYLSKTSLTKQTIANKRRMLLTLWKAADLDGLTAAPPRRIRPVRVSRRCPEAWTQEEVDRLLAVVRKVRGWFRSSGVSRWRFWVALILVAWDTGLRLGDLLRLRWTDLEESGDFRWEHHKTRTEVLKAIQPETLRTLAALRVEGHKTVFAWVLSRRRIQKQFADLVKKAGLKGSMQKLRKSAATAVEKERPGAATAFLGHRTPRLAAQHYIDPRIIQGVALMPPRLTG